MNVGPRPPAHSDVMEATSSLELDERMERLNRMINEVLLDFAEERRSERRLKIGSARPIVVLPRSWAKKAG